MRAYLLNVWDNVTTSYWLVPALFATAALLMSFIVPAIDASIAGQALELPTWIEVNADTARATLSAIASAMVAVTGTVFSITIVTLSLTSQQFGPRLIRRFMYDVPTKITLGVFLSTGFYCLLVLRVGQQTEVDSPHHLSVLVAVVMAVLSMAMLIVFIHHVAMLIQAPHVVASVANDLHHAIDRLFPDPVNVDDSGGGSETSAVNDWKCNGTPIVLRSAHEGYIQAIDNTTLKLVAAETDVVIRLLRRPGHFVSPGTPLAEVCSFGSHEKASGQAAETSCDEQEMACRLNDAVIVGIRRTPRQDLECVVEELVEVAVRSLSPGINDPFTATNCVDRLGAAMGRLATREPLRKLWHTEEGRLCLVSNPVCFANVLGAAFNQIRQYGADSVAVVMRLLEAFASIAANIHREEDREALRKHVEMVARLSGAVPVEHDRVAIERRAEEARQALDKKSE